MKGHMPEGLRGMGGALGCLVAGVLAAAGAGCEFEDRPRTVVEDLRVQAGRVVPPEIAFPEETWDDPLALHNLVDLDFSFLVVDPGHPNASFDVSVIACTEVEGICLESLQYALVGPPYTDDDGIPSELAWRDYLSRHTWRGTLTLDDLSGVVTGGLDSFEGWPVYLQQLSLVDTSVNLVALVCRQGACPVFEDLDHYLADDDIGGGEALVARLAHKDVATQGLKLGDYSLARKVYKVSLRDPVDANRNPDVQTIYFDGVASPEASLKAQQTVTVKLRPSSFEEIYGPDGLLGIEALTVSLFSTDGVLAPNVQQVSYTIGETATSWELPDPQPAYLWAIVRDARGGMGWMEVRAEP